LNKDKGRFSIEYFASSRLWIYCTFLNLEEPKNMAKIIDLLLYYEIFRLSISITSANSCKAVVLLRFSRIQYASSVSRLQNFLFMFQLHLLQNKAVVNRIPKLLYEKILILSLLIVKIIMMISEMVCLRRTLCQGYSKVNGLEILLDYLLIHVKIHASCILLVDSLTHSS